MARALINTGADQISSFGRIVMAGDATIGGTGRFDIRRNTPRLETGGNPYTLTKVGTNQFALVDAFVDPAPGDVHIVQGVFGVQLTTNGGTANTNPLGNPNFTVTIENGAALNFFRLGTGSPLTTPTPFNKKIVVNDGGIVWAESYLGNIVGDPAALQTFVVNGAAKLQAGDLAGGTGSTAGMTINNIISGSGGVTKTGSGTVKLNEANTYTGTTGVSQGTLIINGDAPCATIFTKRRC